MNPQTGVIIIYLAITFLALYVCAYVDAIKLIKNNLSINDAKMSYTILYYIFWPIGILTLLFSSLYIVFVGWIIKFMEKK